MRKLLFVISIISLLVSCQKSLENRAAKELKAYTQKYCPTPVVNNVRTDSAVYEADSHTLHYYYSLYNVLDNPKVVDQHKKEMRNVLLKDLKSNTSAKVYKDAGFAFRFTYRSSSNPKTMLLDETFTQKDYK